MASKATLHKTKLSGGNNKTSKRTQEVANNTLQSNGFLEPCAKKFEIVENEPKDYSGSQSHVDYDHEWKTVVRRIDHGFLLIFLFIFSMLVLVVNYPYKRSVTLESGRCDDI